MPAGNIADFMPRRSRAGSTFNNTYQTLGAAISDPGVIVKIVNNTNQDLDVSIDGTEDHDFVPANSFVLYDFRTNKGEENDFLLPKLRQFYVKGAAVGTGNVYLVVVRERP